MWIKTVYDKINWIEARWSARLPQDLQFDFFKNETLREQIFFFLFKLLFQVESPAGRLYQLLDTLYILHSKICLLIRAT